MKKLLVMIMAVLIVVPLVSVMAIEGNYYTYGVGDEVNFYMYEGDQTGSRTIILTEEGANSQYVRALVTGVIYTTSTPWAEQEIDKEPANFKTLPGYKELQTQINVSIGGASYARNAAEDTTLLTLDDLINVFGATKNADNTYSIDWAKWGHVFSEIPTSALGIYTQTVEGDQQWVIEFTRNDKLEVVSAVVKQESVYKTNVIDGHPSTLYAYIPVLYVDKTYDCTERDAQDKFACYDCNGEYIWTEVGQQADTCNLIEDVKVQSSCVKNVKTGIDQYFIQFGLIAGVCALALVAVNRKNLFKNI